jgi:hypothetical protein
MKRHRTDHRKREQLNELFKMAAPGCAPWKSAESACPTGKRRWPTERAADAALLSAQQTRMRRARGRYQGKLEDRVYACGNCEGYHLTSMSAEEYESTRNRGWVTLTIARARR